MEINTPQLWIIQLHILVFIGLLTIYLLIIYKIYKRNALILNRKKRKIFLIKILIPSSIFLLGIGWNLFLLFDPFNIYNPTPSSGNYLFEYIQFLKDMRVTF